MPLAEEACRLLSESLGVRNMHTAEAQLELAKIRHSCGYQHAEEASEILWKALETAQRLVGLNHSTTTSCVVR